MLLRTLAFVVLLASAGSAYAQTPPPGPATSAPMTAGRGHGAMEACAADRKNYCADVERGGGRIFKCLRDNLVRLAPACQAAVQSMPAGRREGPPAPAPGQ